MYCLWLNGKKVYTLQQLRASFDAEAVELYCLGGGLARWLRDCGEQDTAEKVEQIDLSKSISCQLAEIFGIDLPETDEQEYPPSIASNPSIPTANGSFAAISSSFSDTSLSLGSFESFFNSSSFAFSNVYTSFFNTSFLTTSFKGGYEYEYERSSFTTSSFFSALSTGSFTLGSGSFAFASFTTEYGSFPIGSGSFHLALSSFSPKSTETAPAAAPEKEQPLLTPQQKFALNISSCPLNRYGYGIHLI